MKEFQKLYSILFDFIRFRSDHNTDNTPDIINAWLATETAQLYHNINVEITSGPTAWTNETSTTNWPVERHMHIIDSKEEALNYAKQIWADFVFVSLEFVPGTIHLFLYV